VDALDLAAKLPEVMISLVKTVSSVLGRGQISDMKTDMKFEGTLTMRNDTQKTQIKTPWTITAMELMWPGLLPLKTNGNMLISAYHRS
jgi:hypothetical protein